MRAGVKYYELSSVCTSITDGSHFSPKEDPEGLIPMLSVKDMAADGFDYTSCKYIGENDYQVLVANGCRPSVGDVLVAKDGSYLKTAFVQKSDKDQAILSSIAILTPKTDIIISEYLALFFKAPHTKATVEKHYLTGTAIKRVILKGFKVIKAPVPPLVEQERIVAELDLLQGIIDKQKAQLKELDTLAQSIFYDMFGDPVENEKGWTKKMVKEIAQVKIGPFGSLLHASDYITGGCPVINPIHMKDGKICPDTDFTVDAKKTEEMSSYTLKKDDIIFGRRGDIGRCALVSENDSGFICGTGSLFVRFTQPIVSRFAIEVFLSNEMRKLLVDQAKGATMLNINCGIVEGLSVIQPPLPLQQSFATKIEVIECQKASINASIAETQKLFDYTMDKYFG